MKRERAKGGGGGVLLPTVSNWAALVGVGGEQVVLGSLRALRVCTLYLVAREHARTRWC